MKNNNNFKTILSVILIVGFIAVTAIQSLQISALAHEINFQEQERTWDTKLIYACYNNDIHPCNDEGVSAWNEQNPDKAVTKQYLQNLQKDI